LWSVIGPEDGGSDADGTFWRRSRVRDLPPGQGDWITPGSAKQKRCAATARSADDDIAKSRRSDEGAEVGPETPAVATVPNTRRAARTAGKRPRQVAGAQRRRPGSVRYRRAPAQNPFCRRAGATASRSSLPGPTSAPSSLRRLS